MEKRLNKKIESHCIEFKNDIRNKINTLEFSESSKINELLEYIYDYEKLQLQKDDFVKRKRVKNTIPSLNRCNAKRCNGEQCTRRRKDNFEFCGTHEKGTPHGLALNDITTALSTVQNVEVFVVNIQGIAYYLDNYENVYSTEDILGGKQDPQIVAKYKKEGVNYSIVRFTTP